EARDDFVAALRKCSGSDRVAVLGFIMQMDFSLDDKASAERHAKETLMIDPDHSFANYIMGSITLGREQYASAEAYLTRSLSGDPGFVPAMNDLAMVQHAVRKDDEAEATVRRLLSIRRDLYSAWDTLGLVLLAKDDANGAFSAFETALQLEDNDPRVLLHVAMALAAKGDMEAARTRAATLYASAYVFTGQDARDFENLRRKLKK
ncbi:MAG: tetratricopeptide repeat protein, partial [Kiritimatiellae bacterium]|nr:tetratricopeptide repeat protein [Kiritimatiellia bacterium]